MILASRGRARRYVSGKDRGRLVVNKRWTVEITPRPSSVQVGEEEAPWRFVRRADRWRTLR